MKYALSIDSKVDEGIYNESQSLQGNNWRPDGFIPNYKDVK